MNILTHKSGMLYREDTGDLESIKDCIRNYRHLNINENDVCLDLGANIGGFTYLNAPKCKQVVAIEASNSNYEMLEKNVSSFSNVVLYNGAIVRDDFEDDVVKFVTTNTKISSLSGKILQKDKPRKDQICEEIKAYRIGEIIEKYSPTIVKIDVEGAEYGILEVINNTNVKQITGELHGMTKDTRSKMFALWNLLKENWNVEFYEEKIMFGNPALINFTIRR